MKTKPVHLLLLLALLCSPAAAQRSSSTNATHIKGWPLVGTPAAGQTWCRDGANKRFVPCSGGGGGGGVSFGDAAPPANCTAGQLYLRPSQQSIYLCTSANTWFPFLISNPAPSLQISATNAVLMDRDTGRVIWGKEEHAERAPASTTKMMTGLLAVEYDPELDDLVTVAASHLTGGTSAGLVSGEKMVMSEMLRGLLLASGNDAAAAMADHIGRTYLGGDASTGISNFVDRMNSRAAELGLSHTHFANPSGLDGPGHYSSAYDLAQLASVFMERPELAAIVGDNTYRGQGTVASSPNYHKWIQTNEALCAYPGTTGIKTGTTPEAREALVATNTVGTTNLIAVVMNSTSRYPDMYSLFDYGHTDMGSTGIAASSCQENSPLVAFGGTWNSSGWFSVYDQGYATFSSATNATATITFTGTGIDLIGYKSGTKGIIEISLDEAVDAMVDLYNPTAISGQLLYSKRDLAKGTHTLKIRLTGTRNAASTGNTFDFDAFRIYR